MKLLNSSFFLLVLVSIFLSCNGQPESSHETGNTPKKPARVLTGAEVLIQDSLSILQGKKIGLAGNHTSQVFGSTHLVDTLLALGVELTRVFSPEHGFRGDADAGAKVKSITDPATGLPIISLYGSNKKPSPQHLEGLDIVLFDMQDVGARFYTYISTLSYIMEACAEAGIPVMVLDRPNPNGWYVDGPLLEPPHNSFIGMHPVPIVHGMTIGEYARMVNGEGWLKEGLSCELTVLKARHYTHAMRWEETGLPWIAPSPNLATVQAAELYPALCWFEPTPMSVGRGTDSAFTILGAPWFQPQEGLCLNGMCPSATTFTPRSLPGKSTYPKFQDQACQGYTFNDIRIQKGSALFLLGITLFRQAYAQSGEGEGFFKSNFERWPGYRGFREAIIEGDSPIAIYQSWQEKLNTYQTMRKAYLLYP